MSNIKYVSERRYKRPEERVLEIQDVSRFKARLVDCGCDVDVIALPEMGRGHSKEIER